MFFSVQFNFLVTSLLVIFVQTELTGETNDMQSNTTPLPIVMWHGIADNCCKSFSMGSIQKFLEQSISGVYVHSLMIGDHSIADFKNSFTMNINDQVSSVCSMINSDTNLIGGYNAIGFSQGGQFLRAVAQRCPNPPMENLISLGGQHQGVYGFPRCRHRKVCKYVRGILKKGAYTERIQKNLVQAQYWHDPLDEDTYRNKSLFLADINNENFPKNETYKENLMKLENFVMVKFTEDKMVDPKETEWFGFYKAGQAKELLSLQETDLYKEDRLGLKAMDQQKKLHFLAVVGDHLHMDLNWFKENIVDKFLV